MKPSFLGGVAKIGGEDFEYGWGRVAIVARQLMSDPEKEYEEVGGKFLAVGVKDSRIKALLQLEAKPLLAAVDDFIVQVFSKYARTVLVEAPLSAHMKAMHLMLAKCGGILKDQRAVDSLGKIEVNLRKALLESNPSLVMPLPVLADTVALENGDRGAVKAKTRNKPVQPVALSQPVAFESGGGVCQDSAFKLSCRIRQQAIRNLQGCLPALEPARPA